MKAGESELETITENYRWGWVKIHADGGSIFNAD